MNKPIYQLFWAKTDEKKVRPEWTRPLWAHLLDVANAAHLLWECMLPESLKAQFARALRLDVDAAGWFLSFWLGLHDVGKAIPSFQSNHEPSKIILSGRGLYFPKKYDRYSSIHHGHASIAILVQWVQERFSFDRSTRKVLESLSAFVGFHHGKFCTARRWNEGTSTYLGDGWTEHQFALIDAVSEIWNPVWPDEFDTSNLCPGWMLGFAGWVTLADWIGSMAEYYPDVEAFTDPAEYLKGSRKGAECAIKHAGLDHRSALTAPGFLELFGDGGIKIKAPRPLQQKLIDLEIPTDDTPTLTIVEAPTGEGKTEAALYLAARQQANGRGAGIYVAMPSQATSNGLFARFERFLERSHDDTSKSPINLILVHGNSLLHPDQQRLLNTFSRNEQLAPIYRDDIKEDGVKQQDRANNIDNRTETASWFLPKKRSLLMPYGVGTVDQAFLSVLYARHFFLRLFGLAGKTVIFDEVHAYDVYMSRLFIRLLLWLKELGTSVIVLSATLPERSRQEILSAWKGQQEESKRNQMAEYPAVWSSQRDTPIHFAASQSQHAVLDWMEPCVESVAQRVVDAYMQGGTIGVIVNTVYRAQIIYKAVGARLQKMGEPVPDEDIVLFHARFPFGKRLAIEQQVLKRFGKDRPGDRPGILVATQVAEQSLDLDFDQLYSDLAPIDFLLQRAGRLHRHKIENRPQAFSKPQMIILCPVCEEGELPDLSDIGGGSVYDLFVLYKTWNLLRLKNEWNLPEDYRILIESVYSNNNNSLPDAFSEAASLVWEEAVAENRKRHDASVNEAQRRLIPSPSRLKELFGHKHLELADSDEADPHLHKDYRAMTRLGSLSLEVVCIHEAENGNWFLDAEYEEPVPRAPLNHEALVRLQNNSLRLSNPGVVFSLIEQEVDRWNQLVEDAPAVARQKVLIFRDRIWKGNGNTIVEYHDKLGLIIYKKEN